MRLRAGPVLLTALLVIVHAQLWFGRGSVPRVRALRDQLEQQNALNQQAQAANRQLGAEVSDLREGLEMVEEKARMELGMIKADEIFVQIAR